MNAFDCKVVKVPSDWDCQLPSDIALQLPGHDAPTILLNAKVEVAQAGFDRSDPVSSVIFCNQLKKGHEHLTNRGVLPGPIEDGGDTREGHLIQICKEP
jgi:hypothetical protein